MKALEKYNAKIRALNEHLDAVKAVAEAARKEQMAEKRQEILRSLSTEQLRELERLHLAGDEEALNRYWRECLRGFFSEGSEPPRI